MSQDIKGKSGKGPEATELYKSLRSEILEQKKCQFQLISFAASITIAVLAYAAKSYGADKASHMSAIAFALPILLNNLSMYIILDKSFSIRRMVGYLRLMETEALEGNWSWENHLEAFRGRTLYTALDLLDVKGVIKKSWIWVKTVASREGRKKIVNGKRMNTYVIKVCEFLIVLNIICFLFYSSALLGEYNLDFTSITKLNFASICIFDKLVWVAVFSIFLIYGAVAGLVQRNSMILDDEEYTAKSIEDRWRVSIWCTRGRR